MTLLQKAGLLLINCAMIAAQESTPEHHCHKSAVPLHPLQTTHPAADQLRHSCSPASITGTQSRSAAQ